MNKKLRPIIKWTGGKYDEFALFAPYIPDFENYIEPFFGGGGTFFALQPKGNVFINDKSSDLINFYQQINNAEFKIAIFEYATAWHELGVLSTQMWDKCADSFVNYIENNISNEVFNLDLIANLTPALKLNTTLNLQRFIINEVMFKQMLLNSLLDKAKRIKKFA